MRRRRPVALAIALAAVTLIACTNKDAAAVNAAPRLSDGSYMAAVARICSHAVAAFNTATTLGQTPTRAQTADFLDGIDATFATMVTALHAVPARPADQAAVTSWLTDWDAYVTFGHTYADAVRAGQDAVVQHDQAARQGALRRRLRAFATANRLPSCKFP